MTEKIKKLLLTGGSGFIGSHLISFLENKNFTLGAIGRSSLNKKSIQTFIGNITDREFVRKTIIQFDPQYIVHLTAFKERSIEIEDFYTAIDVNLIGTLNILSAALELKDFKKIVSLGTLEEYGFNQSPFNEKMREAPISSYSFSKVCLTHLSETFGRIYNLPSIVIRPSIAYGPNQKLDMFLPTLIHSLLSGNEFHMTYGLQKRNFIFINDLIDLIYRALISDEIQKGIFNAGSKESYRIIDVANTVGEALGKSSLIKAGKYNLRPLEFDECSLDLKETEEKFGWTASVDLRDGILKTIDYFEELLNEK